ncbi:hypothetical protein [Terriglobus albidus]|uniref:hypothetical protein n=1 Tax=Terriglobus albidus TaxID=1592106 RepID=UPI0021DF7E40|nr:hypothetical protein [Terriglobus albidus]
MTRSQFLWCLKLLGYWLLAYIAIQVAAPVRYVLWWMLRSGGRIHEPLGLFNTRTYLPFQIAWGCFLGLFPLPRVVDAFRVMFGRFRRTLAPEVDERHRRRPILWAWAPPTAIFLLRFLSFHVQNESVFGGNVGVTRWQYFFSNYMLEWLNLTDPLTLRWMIDRLAIAGPMLLTIAYAVTVHLRLRMQERWPLQKTASEPPAI